MWISRITQILTENHVNITNLSTISSRHGPHAIRRIALQSKHACGLALMNRTFCNHSEHLHLSISTWTQTRRLRGMNPKWPHHVALRKKVLDELIMDVWTETIQHEENEERQKHEQTVILKSNSGWKTFWRTTAMRERKPPGNKTGCAPTPFHPKNGKQQRTDTSCITLRPTLQNDSNFTAPHWRRNMRFLMCPSMTWNTVPLGGHAHSHKIQLTAPPSQHLIEQTRTTTGRHSVAFATPTL